MKSNTSVLRIAKSLASVGIVFTVSNLEGAQATSSQAQTSAQIKAVAEEAAQALSETGAAADIEHMIHSHVDSIAQEHVSRGLEVFLGDSSGRI